MVEKILFIDNRERSGLETLIKKYCDKNKLKYQTRQNMITDYAFGSVGIEAKSIQDYMQSLFSGHLEGQLANLDDNYNQMILVIHGTVDQYVAGAMKGGRKVNFARTWGTFIGSLARWDVDYDITIITFPDKSSAARFICKRFEKHDTIGSASTYRVMRKTKSEDMRVDVLRGAGCSETIAKRLLDEHGSIVEISGLSVKELMQTEGVGKVRAGKIIQVFNVEEPVVSERVKMSRA